MPAEVADILQRIVAQRRQRIAESTGGSAALAAAAAEQAAAEKPRGFVEALRNVSGRRIIAEVKLGSPRLGSLVGRVDPEQQARLYAEHGAAALSVVVEPDFFHGSYELLARCRAASGLPALAKDFIVDRVQLDWAQAAGASAILLIAALYSRTELHRYADAAEARGLAVLVETHDSEELSKLAGRDWPLVGVNNRDLRTFAVDLAHSERLAAQLPAGALKVAESGLDKAASLTRLEEAGFDAFLIGESLLLASDPGEKLRQLLGD